MQRPESNGRTTSTPFAPAGPSAVERRERARTDHRSLASRTLGLERARRYAILDQAGELIERKRREDFESRQPRFKSTTDRAYKSLMKWLTRAELQEPDWNVDSRLRDLWLTNFWMMEPHLAGVINSTVALDKNRGWTLIGGRNQVNRYRQILLHDVEGGKGWRDYISKQATSYYTTDLGFVSEVEVEVGEDGLAGPLRNLYHVDPTHLKLTGNPLAPLRYFPPTVQKSGLGAPQLAIDLTRPQDWPPGAFLHATSMPTILEDYRGLGFCATSRCLEFAKMMLAVFRYDQEQLGARMPRGILTLHNVDESVWNAALSTREVELTSIGREWFGGVMVLTSSGVDEIKVVLTALSQLPAEFDRASFTTYTMAGIALCFGMDPAEYWPVEVGGLGRSEETRQQHRKATSKGVRDFALIHQERLQSRLPDSLMYEVEERDAEGLQFDADLQQTWMEIITTLYTTENTVEGPLVDRNEARALLGSKSIIPLEWTTAINEAEADDSSKVRAVRVLRDRYGGHPRFQQACASFYDEPIVQFDAKTGRTITIWDSGAEALRRHTWHGYTSQEVERTITILKPVDYTTTVKQLAAALYDAASNFATVTYDRSTAERHIAMAIADAWASTAHLALHDCASYTRGQLDHVIEIEVGRATNSALLFLDAIPGFGEDLLPLRDWANSYVYKLDIFRTLCLSTEQQLAAAPPSPLEDDTVGN